MKVSVKTLYFQFPPEIFKIEIMSEPLKNHIAQPSAQFYMCSLANDFYCISQPATLPQSYFNIMVRSQGWEAWLNAKEHMMVAVYADVRR